MSIFDSVFGNSDVGAANDAVLGGTANLGRINFRRALGQALLERGLSQQAQGPYAGLLNAANDIAGAWLSKGANDQDTAAYRTQLAQMLGGEKPAPTYNPQVSAGPDGQITATPDTSPTAGSTFEPGLLGLDADRSKLLGAILAGQTPEQGRATLNQFAEASIMPHGVEWHQDAQTGEWIKTDKVTGEELGRVGSKKPFIEVDPTKLIFGADQGGGAAGAAGPAQAPTDMPPDAGGAPPPPVGSVAGRNLAANNPGNMRVPGQKAFQTFPTMQAGIDAVGNQLGLYMQRGNNTIAGMVNTYAPASDNNDTKAYIANVSRLTGLDPDKPLTPADIPKVRDAFITTEQGGRTPQQLLGGTQLASNAPGLPAGAVPPPAPGNGISIPGYHQIQTPPRILQVKTPEEAAQYGVPLNTYIDRYTKLPLKPSDVPMDMQDPRVRMYGGLMAAGRPLPAGAGRDQASMRAYGAVAEQILQQQHPEMTPEQLGGLLMQKQMQAQASQRLLDQFQDTHPNAAGGQIAAANNAIGHTHDLIELAHALNNGDTAVINKWRNWYRAQTGSEAPTDYNSLLHIVGPEIVKAIVPGGGGEGERQSMMGTLSSDNAMRQIEGSANAYMHALGRQMYGKFVTFRSGNLGNNPADFAKQYLAPDATPFFMQAFNNAEHPGKGGGGGQGGGGGGTTKPTAHYTYDSNGNPIP